MKTKFLLFSLLGVSLFFISAKPAEIKTDSVLYKSQVAAAPFAANTANHKLSFFQKIIYKLFVKKNHLGNNSKPDSLAKVSLVLGAASLGLLLLAFANPIVALVSIPIAIGARITGHRALKQGTSKSGQAKTGKALGLAAILIVAVVLLLGLIIVAMGSLNLSLHFFE